MADSALYTKKTIGWLSGKVQWVTRVPETVGPLKKLLEEIPEESFVFDPERPGYRWCELGSTFGGVRQRWVVVFSRSARDREEKTLERERRTLEKAQKEITGLRFSCPDDARKGFFVLATNALDDTRLSGRDLLDLYKAQGTSIELGFLFLKDPLFFADAFFLKSEKRIMALTMVMAIALLIYPLAEEELWETLKKLRESLPDQKKKPTSRPTMWWPFSSWTTSTGSRPGETRGERSG